MIGVALNSVSAGGYCKVQITKYQKAKAYKEEMIMGRSTTAGIQAEIAKGVFRPHTALTNMTLAYYQNASNYFAKAISRLVR